MIDEVEEIKSKIDIVSLIGEYVDLKKAGRNYKANCPFHSEKTASFMVSPELQLYKCFGCGAGGDAFKFLMEHEGMEFYEALKYLATKVGVTLKPRGGATFSIKEKLYEVNLSAAKLYHYILLKHPLGTKGLKYVKEVRGISDEAISTFMLGMSPDSPHALSDFLTKKKGFAPKDLEMAGLIVGTQRGMMDRFRGRVIFPLTDHRGNVVALAGRILPDTKADLAKYINSPETQVYHKGDILYGLSITKGDIKREGKVVVVEGELDAISSWSAGVKNVVAIKGSALTEEHVRVLSRLCKEVILCLDSDVAGNEAARRGVFMAANAGLEVKVATLTKYKDPDDAARADPEYYKEELLKAVGAWDFIVDSIIKKSDVTSGSGKAKISKELIPILASISDKIVQAHYVGVVAARLGVSADVVFAQMEKTAGLDTVNLKVKPAEEKKESVGVAVTPKNSREIAEEALIRLVFATDPTRLADEKIVSIISTPVYAKIIKFFNDYIAKGGKYDPNVFSGLLPKELLDTYVSLLLTGVDDLMHSEDQSSLEISQLCRRIKDLDLREKRINLTAQIAAYEQKEDRKSVEELESQIKEIDAQRMNLEQDYP